MPADQPAALSSASREDAERYALERTDVLRLRSLLPLGRLEFDLLVLIQRPVARTRDRGEVDEHVRRPVIGGDETKALVGVEPLHCSRCHQFKSFIRDARTRPRRADREPTCPGLRNRIQPPAPPAMPVRNRHLPPRCRRAAGQRACGRAGPCRRSRLAAPAGGWPHPGPRYSGFTAWRFVAPHTAGARSFEPSETWGRGTRTRAAGRASR